MNHPFFITPQLHRALELFFDMNLDLAMKCIKMDGTYVTCGIRDQHPIISEETPKTVEPIVRIALSQAIIKNVTLWLLFHTFSQTEVRLVDSSLRIFCLFWWLPVLIGNSEVLC